MQRREYLLDEVGGVPWSWALISLTRSSWRWNAEQTTVLSNFCAMLILLSIRFRYALTVRLVVFSTKACGG